MIQLHPQPRSCFTCANARFPTDPADSSIVTYCSIYEEIIASELYAAEDCFTFELCAEGDQVVDDQHPEGFEP